jgi:hypothetical protein
MAKYAAELSNKIIEKELAFLGEQSGTVVHPRR